jgi:ribonuclease HIII
MGVTSLVPFALVGSETVSESSVISRDLFLTTILTLGVEVGVASLGRPSAPAFVESLG